MKLFISLIMFMITTTSCFSNEKVNLSEIANRSWESFICYNLAFKSIGFFEERKNNFSTGYQSGIEFVNSYLENPPIRMEGPIEFYIALKAPNKNADFIVGILFNKSIDYAHFLVEEAMPRTNNLKDKMNHEERIAKELYLSRNCKLI